MCCFWSVYFYFSVQFHWENKSPGWIGDNQLFILGDEDLSVEDLFLWHIIHNCRQDDAVAVKQKKWRTGWEWMFNEQLLMKKASFVERMKTKNFYIVLGFILISSGTIWLLSYPSPTFQNIVTKTHKGIKNLPSNIQIQVGGLTCTPLSQPEKKITCIFSWNLSCAFALVLNVENCTLLVTKLQSFNSLVKRLDCCV